MIYRLILFFLLIATSVEAQTVTWVNDRGGTGTAVITGTNWTTAVGAVPLKAGINNVTVTYTDPSGTTTDSIAITYTPTFPGNALIGAYAFKDGSGPTATDTASGFTGSLVNGPVWTTQGKFDSALTFDGVDSYVNVADANPLDFTQSFTISAYVKPTNTTGWRTVAAKGQNVNATNFPLQFLYATQPGGQGCAAGQIQAGFIANGVLGPVQFICSTGSPLATGVYSHVAFSYDGPGPGSNLRIYINGALNNTVAATGLMEPSTGVIGAWKIGADDYGDAFAGDIDEVRLYNWAIPRTTAINSAITPTCSAAQFADNVATPSIMGNANCPIITPAATPPLVLKFPSSPTTLKMGAGTGTKLGQP